MFDQPLPIDHAAEADVIQALITAPGSRAKLFSRIMESDFHGRDARSTYRKLRAMWDSSVSIDSLEVQEAMACDAAAGAALKTARGGMWPEAMESVLSHSYRRRAAIAAVTAYRTALDPCVPMNDLRECVDRLCDSTNDGRTEDMPPDLEEYAARYVQLIQDARAGNLPKAMRWGLAGMNMIQRRPGDIHVVGARPAVGKTAFAISNMLCEAADGIRPGLFCFEMDGEAIFARCVSQYCGISVTAMFDGLQDVSTADLDEWQRATTIVRSLPMQMDCGKPRNVNEIRRIATEWVRHRGTNVLYVDYAQDIVHNRRDQLRESVMHTLSHLKATAQMLGVPIVLLAQLNREADGIRPQMKHLQESGYFEQIAHSITLLDRPDIEKAEKKDRGYGRWVTNAQGGRYKEAVNMDGKCAAIVAKQRNGRTGIIYFDYLGELMKFQDEGNHRRHIDESGTI